MQANERIEKFLTLQNKNIKFDDISKELGVASKTLKSFLNKKGYKMEEGVYKLKEEAKEANQIAFTEIKEKAPKSTAKKAKTTETIKSTKKEVVKETKPKVKSKATTKSVSKEKETTIASKAKSNISTASKAKATTNVASKVKPKKDRKINIIQEDLDKLCEVYDWYLEVKDNKTLKPKKASNKKDIVLDEAKIDELKSTTIRLDKSTWEDFERLCSNSEYSKQEIITQALKDFMKEYKYLL